MSESETLEDLHHALVQALEAHADPERAAKDRRFHKYDDYKSYGVESAVFGEIVRRFRTTFRQLTLAQRLLLARELLESGISEQAGIATHLLAISANDLTPDHFERLDCLADHFHSWSTTDDFCINVLQPLLWKYREDVLKLLRGWSKSGNRWKRRASVVAFVRKVGASGQFTEEALELCEALAEDQDDLVQKAVGWALKDTMRGAKESVVEYVKDLRRRGAPSTITLYAIRDLKGQERRAVLDIKAGVGQS